jgi:hypothetical protein
VNISILTQEISNIKERLIENEEKYKEMLKIIKAENIGMRKVTTEMVNNRMNGIEHFMDIIMKHFAGLEKENAELKEQMAEVQTEVKEMNSREKTRKISSSSESDDDHPKKKKSSGSSSSDEENDNLKMKKITAQEVLNKLREPDIEVRTAEGKIEKDWYSLEIYIKKYAQFVHEINEYNGMLLAEEFNNNERVFEGVYYYPKELQTKDIIIGMKVIMENNGIHPHPFKFVCGMQQCTSQFDNKGQQLDHIEIFHKKQQIRTNLDEYLISQVFHNNFIPSKLNSDSREVYEENFWDERIQC